jgi:hypothetical protein
MRLLVNREGEQLVIIPAGFFTASQRDTRLVAIVRGLEVVTIGQVHQSLFNPDLVREALAGDPNREVEEAAKVINLDKVLDGGPAPVVTIVSHPPGSQSAAELVTIQARVADKGKGVGRIEWRANGVTVGVTNGPDGVGPDYEVSQSLALDPGENRIEVVAYNRRNLPASQPAETTIRFTGPADTVKPRLHVLAIGINQYQDRGWISPDGQMTKQFGLLHLAVNDAYSIGEELKKAGAGLYSEVRVKTVLDREATVANLEAVVTEMAADIQPRDTFVFFSAGSYRPNLVTAGIGKAAYRGGA